MDPVIAIAFWAATFLGSHLLISSDVVRPSLVAAVGEQTYRGIYSLVALATFVPLVVAFAYHKHSGALLWNLRGVAPMRWLVWLLMLCAFILFVASLMNPNPAALGAPSSGANPRGVLKITRHPNFIALSLFGFAHILMNGFTGDVIFFGTFPALGILGGMHQDRRKENELGQQYRDLEAQTSFIPGLALLDGRQRWSAADTPWTAIAVGIAITAIILWLHPRIFGGFPLGNLG